MGLLVVSGKVKLDDRQSAGDIIFGSGRDHLAEQNTDSDAHRNKCQLRDKILSGQ